MTVTLLVFDSTHNAIAAKKLLGQLFPIRILPTPVSIDADCGISIAVSPEHRREAAAAAAPYHPHIYTIEEETGCLFL